MIEHKSIFDPNTGALVDPEALRSIRFGGGVAALPPTRRTESGELVQPWRNEDDGGVGGFDVKKQDGGVDVTVFGRPVIAGGGD